jgi:ACS family sodium-dependent inorganic phosphate cotransporter
MTENRTIHHDNGTVSYDQYFNWNSQQKGLVLSSFFYGYITTQFIGGLVAAKIGGNRIFGIGIGMTAILTLLTPLAAKQNFYVLLAVRIIEGVFEGVCLLTSDECDNLITTIMVVAGHLSNHPFSVE